MPHFQKCLAPKGKSLDNLLIIKALAFSFSGGIGIHYWNCEGYDFLKGKDIVVLGTPHLNNVVYNMYAKVIGIDLNNIDLEMQYQKIDWNGFRFMFMAYNDRDMREIQLSLIESELVQAIGRARALRTDARVEVYSNLPLLVSDKFVY